MVSGFTGCSDLLVIGIVHMSVMVTFKGHEKGVIESAEFSLTIGQKKGWNGNQLFL